MERETPLFPPLPAFALAEGFPEATGALADAGAVLETGFAGSGFLTGAFETVLAGVVSFGADFLACAFLAIGAGFLAAAFLAGAFLTTGAGLERGFLAAFLAGSGFLTAAFGAGLVGLASLSAGFFAGAFLTAGVGLTDFPEGFRDGEGLDFFFNVAQLVPKSRARKVR